jgi:hypothetical protein
MNGIDVNSFERSLTIRLVEFEVPHPVRRRQSSRLLRPIDVERSAFCEESASEVVTFIGRSRDKSSASDSLPTNVLNESIAYRPYFSLRRGVFQPIAFQRPVTHRTSNMRSSRRYFNMVRTPSTLVLQANRQFTSSLEAIRTHGYTTNLETSAAI